MRLDEDLKKAMEKLRRIDEMVKKIPGNRLRGLRMSQLFSFCRGCGSRPCPGKRMPLCDENESSKFQAQNSKIEVICYRLKKIVDGRLKNQNSKSSI
jgi:hypothetical protein